MLPRANKAAPSTLKESTDAAEVAAIRRAIEVAGGNVSAAAAALGTPYRTLTWKIRRLGLRDWLAEAYPGRGQGGREPGGAPRRSAKAKE